MITTLTYYLLGATASGIGVPQLANGECLRSYAFSMAVRGALGVI